MFSSTPLFLLLAVGAVGDLIVPTDDTPSESTEKLAVQWTNGATSMKVPVNPLTTGAGMGASATLLNSIHEQGELVVPTDSGNSTTSEQIALLSCDPVDNSDLSSSQIFANVAANKPKAILLYSLNNNTCELNGTSSYTSIFTMIDKRNSLTLVDQVEQTTGSVTANIASFDTLQQSTSTNGTSTGSAPPSSSSGDPNSGGTGTPAPTTAVAMSILYSITGIITLLFLIIIATGAVRAHRHPERYGPRNGFPGRPRQSRAKGLARAMLETLPIVKFGDPEPDKPARDIELESANSNTIHEAAVAAGGREQGELPKAVAEQEGGLGPNQTPPAVGQVAGADSEEDHLGCSICTEDFTRGEDVRVLPCNHKYHPACIDPWLLNVSGTCPLCRVDLRPVQTNGSDLPRAEDFEEPAVIAEATEADTAGMEHNSGTRRRMSRLLDFNRLRHAEPAERIAALRRLRTQDRELNDAAEANGEAPEMPTNTTGPDETRRRSRFARTIRAAFDIRTEHSGSSSTPTPPVPQTSGEGNSSMAGARGT